MVKITRKLKLYPPNKAKEQLLVDIAQKQTACVNFWIEKIREVESTNIKTLQDNFYRPARKKFKLSSLLTQCAKYTAIRLVRTSKKRRSKSPFLKAELITISRIKLDKNNLGITFGDGYFWIPFHSQEIPKGKICESKIKKINNTWYCFLSIDVDTPKVKHYKHSLGVDLGLAKIAVIADEKGRHTKFFSGEQARSVRKHYLKLRKELQPKIKQGNVYKLLNRIRNKEKNWMTNINHQISRSIVNIAKATKRNIVIENLTGIRKRIRANKKTRRMLHSWTYRQLADFIEYKARLIGLEVSSVDPRETSRRCPKCGYIARNNRRTQERFRCRKCDYESNADRIGAMNLAQRVTEVVA